MNRRHNTSILLRHGTSTHRRAIGRNQASFRLGRFGIHIFEYLHVILGLARYHIKKVNRLAVYGGDGLVFLPVVQPDVKYT